MYRPRRAYDDKPSVGVFGTQYHALRIDSAQAAHGQVGNKTYLTAYEIFGIVVLGNTGDNGASVCRAVIDSKFEQLVGLGHTLTGFASL